MLSEHGLSQNGAVKYLSLLKKVVNRAVANNKIAFNPFASYKLERQEVSPDFLNEDELRRIINLILLYPDLSGRGICSYLRVILAYHTLMLKH